MLNLLDYNYEELNNLVLSYKEQKYRTNQLYTALQNYKEAEEISNLPKNFVANLKEKYSFCPLTIIKKQVGKDGTIKFLYKLNDGNIIEGVLMSYKYGNTICVSTQVGCRMGCKFCASTLNGLVRNLTSGEILAQVLCVNKELGGTFQDRKITNIVLMGSGEPLDNYENVVKFIKMVSCDKGINISQRNISLSTCGLVEKIDQLKDENLQITLTISLHAPNDEIRKQTMPVANKYKIKDIIDATKRYFNKTKRRIVFEYALIENVNDSFDCADELSKLLKGLSCHVNLIPLNDVKERSLKGTTRKRAYAFMDRLLSNNISATVRRTMGEDIDGACGQLRAKYLNNNI